MPQYTREKTKTIVSQFIGVVQCLGPDRIEIKGWKHTFHRYPSIMELLREIEVIQKQIREGILSGETARDVFDTIVSNR